MKSKSKSQIIFQLKTLMNIIQIRPKTYRRAKYAIRAFVGVIFAFIAMTAAVANDINTNVDASSRFKVDCPDDFKNCAQFIEPKISNQVIQKYPASKWKVVVTLARFFFMGNGTLKSHFRIAMLPIDDPITSKEINKYGYKGSTPKKQFVVDKIWPDIVALGGIFADGKMFGPLVDERVYTARKILYERMAAETIAAMNAACMSLENCVLYEK